MISVIMPLHNAEVTMDESLQSILDQTFKEFEIIAVENASTDQTLKKLKEWSQRDTRIKVFSISEKGIVRALNHGIQKASGEWIARIDADDCCESDRFEKQLKFLWENSDIDICGTQIQMFGDKTKISDYSCSHQGIGVELNFRNCIAHPTVMIRRKRLPNFLYEEGFPHAEDYIQWVRLWKKCRFANLPEALLRYRVHTSQITRSQSESVKKSEKLVLEESFENMGIFLTEIDLETHHQFSRHRTFQSGIEILREGRVLSKLWKKISSDNAEGRNLIQNHWNRFINDSTDFPLERTVCHLFSPITDRPLNFWKKSRREKIKKLMGL